VTTIPPSALVITLVAKKENAAASENLPAKCPFKELPMAWAASSIRKRFLSWQIFIISLIEGVIIPAI